MARQFLIGMLIVPYLIICKLIDLCRFIYWAIKLKFYRAKNKPQSELVSVVSTWITSS